MQYCESVIFGMQALGAPAREGCSRPRATGAIVSRTSDGSAILSKRRSEALRALFPKLASWFETSNERARRQEIEAFLYQAKDISDLEWRICWLQRRCPISPITTGLSMHPSLHDWRC
jgi:hypothetical protein